MHLENSSQEETTYHAKLADLHPPVTPLLTWINFNANMDM